MDGAQCASAASAASMAKCDCSLTTRSLVLRWAERVCCAVLLLAILSHRSGAESEEVSLRSQPAQPQPRAGVASQGLVLVHPVRAPQCVAVRRRQRASDSQPASPPDAPACGAAVVVPVRLAPAAPVPPRGVEQSGAIRRIQQVDRPAQPCRAVLCSQHDMSTDGKLRERLRVRRTA